MKQLRYILFGLLALMVAGSAWFLNRTPSTAAEGPSGVHGTGKSITDTGIEWPSPE